MWTKMYDTIPRRSLDVEAILDTCVLLACCTVKAIKTFLRLYWEPGARYVECMPTISIPIRRRSVCKVMRLETSAKPFLRINIEISVEVLERKRNFVLILEVHLHAFSISLKKQSSQEWRMRIYLASQSKVLYDSTLRD